MAIPAATQWEVRTGGADTNGGGFVEGGSGTDWSQQNAPQYSVTDAVTNGTTTITSATANFGTDVVDNLLYIAGGTGSIVGAWYRIVSRTNNTTIVVDRSTGLTTGTGATLKIGGALLTIGAAADGASSPAVSGNTIWVRSGDYTLSAAIDLTLPGSNNYGESLRIVGYGTTRGDSGTQPRITSASAIKLFTSGHNVMLDNLDLDGADVATKGLEDNAGYAVALVNCKVRRFTTWGIDIQQGGGAVFACEFTDMKAGASGCILMAGGQVVGSYIHDSPGVGITIPQHMTVNGNIIANMESHGLSFGSNGAGLTVIRNNTIHGNGGDGINVNIWTVDRIIINNLITNNSGYGVNSSFGGYPANGDYFILKNNAFKSNTSGAVSSRVRANLNPVTLTADPYTNAAGGDFSLNNVAGGGAACRAAGVFGIFPVGLSTGYPDIGAVQHQDPPTAIATLAWVGMVGS